MRYYFISLIYIAFAIQIGHDMIPHHHEHSHKDQYGDYSPVQHHPIDHHHGDENQSGSDFGLVHVLPVMLIASGMETLVSFQFVDSTETKTSIDFEGLYHLTFSNQLVPAAANPPPYTSALSKNLDLAALLLRGPPVSAV